MKTKLHFGILVILLAFLGTYLEQSTAPNQQIVIQFSNADISSEDAENTIEIVRKQLQRIGVTQIQIGQEDNGKLKITYYSDADVNRIQDILSQENHFNFAYGTDHNNSNDFPSNKNVSNYELNISEIQNNLNTNWDFEGILLVEFNQETERFSNPTINSFGEVSSIDYNNSIVKVALSVNCKVANTIDNISYIIPEVRAGPFVREFII
jgi:preprotein translocase subunit SecD